jgi:D-3-phosphoglycerate dehydrogenase / 2-oxoglutarate reductase
MKIALLENIHKVAQDKLQTKGFEVDHFTQSYGGDELIELLKGYQAVGIRSKTMLTPDVLQASRSFGGCGLFLYRHQPSGSGDGKEPGHSCF